MEIIQSSIIITLLIGILFLCLQWLFIYSAVKAATKKATIEAYKEIEKLNNPTSNSRRRIPKRNGRMEIVT